METKVEGSGLCAGRLLHVDACLRSFVDKGLAAGAAGLIIRKGVWAYKKSFGYRDLVKKIPLTDDTIYRIYSMTKTFTIVCAMTLYEKGLFKLHDPISEFLPCFKDMKVAEHDERGCVTFVPAKRPVTFEHLFTMTSGIPYPGDESYSARAMAAVQERSVTDARAGKMWNTAQMVEAASEVPLCFHPGDSWLYGFSHDVLGRLVEVISGRRLSDYMADVIFKPLSLKDTAFYVPPEKQSRVSKAYAWSAGGLAELTPAELPADPASPDPPAFESGGGGLNSTLDDIGRYAQMFLNSGALGGTRILSRKTIDLIRENHVERDLVRLYGFQRGYGYGLGVRTMMEKPAEGLNGSAGEWAWDGMMGTWYCVDPAEEMTAVFMVQRKPGGNDDLPKRFMQTVYAAIDD
jgi:CubicO group peptidase (beta-lactamase class C family)